MGDAVDDAVARALDGVGLDVRLFPMAARMAGARMGEVCRRVEPWMPAPGVLALIRWDGRLAASRSWGGFRMLADGSDQSGCAVFRAFRSDRHGLGIVEGDAAFSFPWGPSDPLYAQAVRLDGGVLVLALEHGAPWLPEGSSPVRRGGDGRRGGAWEFRCSGCGGRLVPEGEGDWCPSCHGRRCRYGHCGRCGSVPERVCPVCFLSKRADLFDDGSDVCRECAS